MTNSNEVVLVLGATGQQGGATARALLHDGWRVRALVRDPESARAKEVGSLGAELVPGDLGDASSLQRAASGAYGVFSIQPSSGQPQYGVSDDDELRFGVAVIEAAKHASVKHFVYTSVAGAAPDIGIGHFESKWKIEQHLRGSGLSFHILRPAPFMEILLSPYCGLSQGTLAFFSAPDQRAQFISVRDIGIIAALLFAEPSRYVQNVFELAGDALSGNAVAAKMGRATGRTIPYARFPAAHAAQSPLFGRILKLSDEGRLDGHADIAALRALHPGLLNFDDWLAHGGTDAVAALLPARQT